MSIIIKRADVFHAGAIALIGKASFRHAFEHLFKDKEDLFEYLEYTYDPVKLSRSIRKESRVYFLATYNGDPVGFAKVKTHSLNDKIDSVSQIEFQKIYVLPQYQGKGVGSALLLEVTKLAKEISPDYIWLDTHVGNEKAIRLYEKNGFQKIGKHFFTIGSQSFEYHVMGLPVLAEQKVAV